MASLPEPSSEVGTRGWWQGLSRPTPHRWLSLAVPSVVSIVSLVFSILAYHVANRGPQVSLSLPDRVRIAQSSSEAWLYLQPRFVGTGPSQRVEVIEGIEVRVEPLDGGQPAAFRWNVQGNGDRDAGQPRLGLAGVARLAGLAAGRGCDRRAPGAGLHPDLDRSR